MTSIAATLASGKSSKSKTCKSLRHDSSNHSITSNTTIRTRQWRPMRTAPGRFLQTSLHFYLDHKAVLQGHIQALELPTASDAWNGVNSISFPGFFSSANESNASTKMSTAKATENPVCSVPIGCTGTAFPDMSWFFEKLTQAKGEQRVKDETSKSIPATPGTTPATGKAKSSAGSLFPFHSSGPQTFQDHSQLLDDLNQLSCVGVTFCPGISWGSCGTSAATNGGSTCWKLTKSGTKASQANAEKEPTIANSSETSTKETSTTPENETTTTECSPFSLTNLNLDRLLPAVASPFESSHHWFSPATSSFVNQPGKGIDDENRGAPPSCRREEPPEFIPAVITTSAAVEEIQTTTPLPISQQHSQPPKHKTTTRVCFGTVRVREFALTVGDHPDISDDGGPPISLDWPYVDKVPLWSVNQFEVQRRQRWRARTALAAAAKLQRLTPEAITRIVGPTSNERLPDEPQRGHTAAPANSYNSLHQIKRSQRHIKFQEEAREDDLDDEDKDDIDDIGLEDLANHRTANDHRISKIYEWGYCPRMNGARRRALLEQEFGVSADEMQAAMDQVQQASQQRDQSMYQTPFSQRKEEILELAHRKWQRQRQHMRRPFGRRQRSKNDGGKNNGNSFSQTSWHDNGSVASWSTTTTNASSTYCEDKFPGILMAKDY